MRKSAPLFCALLLSLSARRAWIEIRVLDGSKSSIEVALRKESVDRNIFPPVDTSSVNVSLSARRAWIEIQHTSYDFPASKVALRKESVDRNFHRTVNIQRPTASLSARRAWIEMTLTVRNVPIDSRRSPQGERG